MGGPGKAALGQRANNGLDISARYAPHRLGDRSFVGPPREDLDGGGLRRLIDTGQKVGFITYESFNGFFPEECNTPDRIDQVYDTLE
ncbi:MAG: hypothetical protein HC786_16690, partial [Richelia sp. CSU_2_1]|nr:hypothetical protein [Richelia sp. CSU_2_1]